MGSTELSSTEMMEKKIIAPNNFSHQAGDGDATRRHRVTDVVPALQATVGSTQCSYVLVYGNYVNVEQGQAGKVVDSSGIAPAVTENHGQVTGVVVEQTLDICKGVRLWGGGFPDVVMKEDIAGAITAQSTFNFNSVVLGYLEHGTGQHQSNTVYDPIGICPALTTIEGGGTQQVKILVENEYV